MLYEKLLEYVQSGVYPMHMPGHKRAGDSAAMPHNIDITEIHGFDNLHDPRGILLETTNLAAELYGSDRAFLLVNGSTVGILAAIGACTQRGDKILMARNCHISVYNAVALFNLIPIYISPEIDEETGISCGIATADVKSALKKNPDVRLVVITSPTYEGVLSDTEAIAETAHAQGIPILIDAAHGAHLNFLSSLQNRISARETADISVMSLHKTLPALTQCALLHIRGERVDPREVARQLSIFQTTSPSYVLLASIDKCLRDLRDDSGRLFAEYEQKLARFRSETECLQNLQILSIGDAQDPGKIVIGTKKTAISGVELSDILREEHKIELEMACADYALAMTSVCDSAEGFARLSKALIAIDASLQTAADCRKPLLLPSIPIQADMPYNALTRRGEFIPLDKSAGLMSLEYIWAYPPGIPIIAPGEIIGADVISYINRSVYAEVGIKSTMGKLPQFIYASGS